MVEIAPLRPPRGLSDPRAILAALSDAGARFVIVGGVAMVIHGSSYVTEDLDVLYARDDDDLFAIVRALAPFRPRLRVAGEPAGVAFEFDKRNLRNGMNFTLTTDGGDVDLLGEIAGVGGYGQAKASATRVSFDGRHYDVLSLSGLIRTKRAVGRIKDLQAIPELEHLLEIEQMRSLERPEEP